MKCPICQQPMIPLFPQYAQYEQVVYGCSTHVEIQVDQDAMKRNDLRLIDAPNILGEPAMIQCKAEVPDATEQDQARAQEL